MSRFVPAILLLYFGHLGAATTLHDFSLSYVRGHSYKLGDNSRHIATAEYVNVSDWGDIFFFADYAQFDNGGSLKYAEIFPRFKLSDIESPGPLARINLSTQIEFGESFTNYLYGIGLDLDIRGFKFVRLNGLYRNNEDFSDNYQLTAVWSAPFKLFNRDWLIDGFFDWGSAVDNRSTVFGLTTQVKVNVADTFGWRSPLYIGIEYVHWNNKFGVKGVNESNPNLLLKYHF